jgi:hypothetical protein
MLRVRRVIMASTPPRHRVAARLARRWELKPFTEFTPDYRRVSPPATRESPLL